MVPVGSDRRHLESADAEFTHCGSQYSLKLQIISMVSKDVSDIAGE